MDSQSLIELAPPASFSDPSDHFDISGQCKTLCECFARVPLLAAGTPTAGEIRLEQVLTNGQHIIESWNKLIMCTKCSVDVRRMRILHTAVQKQVGLYEAGARLCLGDKSVSPGKTQRALVCRETVAYLGSVALEEEEVNMLACHVINQSIVNFVQFLGEMCEMLQQSQGGATHKEEMAEIQDKIRSYVQIILRYIARFRAN